MLQDHINSHIFVNLKEWVLLLTELGHDLSEEVDSVDLVMRVSIHACHHTDNLFDNAWLGQDLEELFVLTEFLQDLAGAERLVHIIRVIRWKHVNEGADDHGALFLEDLLHFQLLFW